MKRMPATVTGFAARRRTMTSDYVCQLLHRHAVLSIARVKSSHMWSRAFRLIPCEAGKSSTAVPYNNGFSVIATNCV